MGGLFEVGEGSVFGYLEPVQLLGCLKQISLLLTGVKLEPIGSVAV